MQRTVQWGQDSLASIFGVACSKPALYAYFACSIRNRLEVWNSDAWHSPTEGSQEGAEWKAVGESYLKRPTKLIDGSRGGQGFICHLLQPQDGGTFTIAEQARMQLSSVILVAAGLMNSENLTEERLENIMRDDFELSDRLGTIFNPLLLALTFGQILAIAFAVIVIYAIFGHNLFNGSAPYIIQLCSLMSWEIGAISLLMLGGNPRVKIVQKGIPPYVEARITAESKNPSHSGSIRLEFGSIHGSVYLSSRGHCVLPVDIVRAICRWDLELQRPTLWKLGFVWSSLFLLISILLQVVGAQVATVGSEGMSIVLLMATALARGWGVAGPEEWLIPRRKMRHGANYGASLLGKMVSRQR